MSAAWKTRCPRDASRVLVPSPLAALDTSRSGLGMRTTVHSWASLDEPRSTRSVWHGPNETEPFLLNLLVEAEEHRRYNAGARPVACQCGGGPWRTPTRFAWLTLLLGPQGNAVLQLLAASCFACSGSAVLSVGQI